MPMKATDLDAVLQIESISHLHPWTRKNFSDSLEAGHWAYCIRPENDHAGSGSYPDPNLLWAYCILYPAVDELHLLNITVTPKLRKLGLGGRLMSAIEGIAVQQGIPRIILEVRPSNTEAVSLYQKLGYHQIGIRKGYYPVIQASGLREDALVLAKTIKLES
jgi:[ribosomal protein S18]-alanine N-acetyltransferase